MTAKHFKQIFIKSEADVPKIGGYYFAQRKGYEIPGYFFFIANEFSAINNYDWYLIESSESERLEAMIEQMWKLIEALRKLNNLCEAPQYHEIIKAKEHQKDIVEIIEQQLNQLKGEL